MEVATIAAPYHRTTGNRPWTASRTRIDDVHEKPSPCLNFNLLHIRGITAAAACLKVVECMQVWWLSRQQFLLRTAHIRSQQLRSYLKWLLSSSCLHVLLDQVPILTAVVLLATQVCNATRGGELKENNGYTTKNRSKTAKKTQSWAWQSERKNNYKQLRQKNWGISYVRGGYLALSGRLGP